MAGIRTRKRNSVVDNCPHTDKPHYVGGKCRRCYAQVMREKNPPTAERKAKMLEASRRYRKVNREKSELSTLRSRLQKTYGISIAEYKSLFASQNNVCAICKKPEGQNRRLSVDHDHELKNVRGLLCHNCNVGLGNFKDSPNILASAIEYLGKVDVANGKN